MFIITSFAARNRITHAPVYMVCIGLGNSIDKGSHIPTKLTIHIAPLTTDQWEGKGGKKIEAIIDVNLRSSDVIILSRRTVSLLILLGLAQLNSSRWSQSPF